MTEGRRKGEREGREHEGRSRNEGGGHGQVDKEELWNVENR